MKKESAGPAKNRNTVHRLLSRVRYVIFAFTISLKMPLRQENRALRRDIKELYSENSMMEKELAKFRKQLMEAESAIKNLKDELLKAQTELALSRMDKKYNSKFSLL